MPERPEELFPILYGYRVHDEIRQLRSAGITTLVLGLPWGMIAPHEMQARSNHGGQTLRRLADRGGLGPDAAVAVLKGHRWERMGEAEAQRALLALLAAHHAGRLGP